MIEESVTLGTAAEQPVKQGWREASDGRWRIDGVVGVGRVG